jgi:hypothetical protein
MEAIVCKCNDCGDIRLHLTQATPIQDTKCLRCGSPLIEVGTTHLSIGKEVA